jgi:hypothetical protein
LKDKNFISKDGREKLMAHDGDESASNQLNKLSKKQIFGLKSMKSTEDFDLESSIRKKPSETGTLLDGKSEGKKK